MRTGAAAIVVAFAMVIAARPALADKTYLRESEAAAVMFPASHAAMRKTLELTRAEVDALGKMLGWRIEATSYPYLEVTLDQQVLGTIFLLDVMGQAQPITFAIGITKDGVVQDVRVMVYREPHGAEIEDARFRRQFVGKGLRDPIVVGKDIDAISGATISSRSETVAVRKTLGLVEILRNQIRKP